MILLLALMLTQEVEKEAMEVQVEQELTVRKVVMAENMQMITATLLEVMVGTVVMAVMAEMAEAEGKVATLQ
jgi:mRNA-degrading endonuclease toxin of MazEF toxin-antitoxin module